MLGSDLITAIQQKAPDIDGTTALQLLQEANDYICARVKIYPETITDMTSLVAGTATYSVSDDILRIWEAGYSTDGTTFRYLQPTSKDELDYDNRGWRWVSNGPPTHVYLDGVQVGLWPPPDTSSALGKPLVRLYTAQRHTLGSNDSLPGNIREQETAWVDEVIYRWFSRRSVDRLPEADALRKASLQSLKLSIQGRLPRDKPSVQYDVPNVNYV